MTLFYSMSHYLETVLHHDMVDLYTPGEIKQGNEGGVYRGEPDPIGSLKCNIQPYSKELAQKEYGLVVDAVLRLYAVPDDRLKLGVLVMWKGNTYKVSAMPEPRSMAVALLERN